jgi:gas vesicle protein
MNTNKVMLGVLAGAAAGAIAGILLAPDKGSATRGSIARRGRETVDNLKGQVNNIVDKVSENYLSGTEDDTRSMGSDTMGTNTGRDRSSNLNSPGSPSRSFS